MKPPTEDELASARRFVQRDGVSIPIDAEWFVLADGRVLTRFRESGGWATSMVDVEALSVADGSWVEVTG